MKNEIICPYCGCVFYDYWYCDESQETFLTNCENCNKSFYATRDIIVTYSTKKAKYGTCKCCGTEDVMLESRNIFNGKTNVEVEDYCLNCIDKEG